MSQNTIFLLQSVGCMLQLINTGMAALHPNPVFALIFSSVVAGFQLYLQQIGNESQPPSTPPPPKTEAK